MPKVSHVHRYEGDPPDDRIHKLADAMLETFNNSPHRTEDVHAIVFVTWDFGGRSYATTGMTGYVQDADAMADILAHVTAMFKANGLEMQFIPVPEPGEG